MRTIYWAWSWLVLAAIVVQVGFAGYGAFYAASKVEDSSIDEDVFFDGFAAHSAFGYLVILAGLVFMVIGLVAGIGRWRLGRHGLLFGLLVLQMLLAWFGFEAPVIGFFHPVNALVLFVLAGWIAWDEWRIRKAGPTLTPAT